jgi:hypothetical protein
MLRLALLAVLVVLSTSVLAQAQNSAPTHQHVPDNLIDGALHPELVPDLTVYRLVLLAISKPPSPTDKQAKHQQAQLHAVGLQETDQKELIAILSNFNYEYRSLMLAYNAAATAANARGERSEISYFLLERNQLVQSTHDKLRTALSVDGWTRFDAYAQGEKKHMKISAKEAKR